MQSVPIAPVGPRTTRQILLCVVRSVFTVMTLVLWAALCDVSLEAAVSDEPQDGTNSASPRATATGTRQGGRVGQNPSPSLIDVSDDRLIQARARIDSESAIQRQRIEAAYRNLQEAQNRGGGGYDSPEQRQLLEEYNRSVRLRNAGTAVGKEMQNRQLRPDGKWDLPDPTRNPPPRDVTRLRGSRSTSADGTAASRGAGRSGAGQDSVAMPNANTARGRSDTVAEGRTPGNSTPSAQTSGTPVRDNTINNGSKPVVRGDSTVDSRNSQSSSNQRVSESGRTPSSSLQSGLSRAPGTSASGISESAGTPNTSNSPEAPSGSRSPDISSRGGTYGRASSPAPVTGSTLFNTTQDAQSGVKGAAGVIVIADMVSRMMNRSADVAEGREISGTGEFAVKTASGLAVGAAAGTVAGVVGGGIGAMVGGAIGFVASAGNPAGAIAGSIAGAQLGAGATVGAMTAIGALRSGQSLGDALDRMFFNGNDPIREYPELLESGLGESAPSNQVASGPLNNGNAGNLQPQTAVDQVQAQLLNQFPELANASPEEQREIALQVLGLSNRERDELMQPTTVDVLEGPPVAEEIPLHPPLDEDGGTEGWEEGARNGVADPTEELPDDLDEMLDQIAGPREDFDGSALEDFMDQLNSRQTEPGPEMNPVDGDEDDFSDPSVSSVVPFQPAETGGDIDVSIFRSAQERDDLRDLFRTDGDYDEAMRLEGALQRAEAAYRKAIEDARRLAAAQRAAEAAERQRQAQIAYNNWLAQYRAWQRWSAQQQAYRNWVAQQRSVSYYSAPRQATGHQSGGLISDPPR